MPSMFKEDSRVLMVKAIQPNYNKIPSSIIMLAKYTIIVMSLGIKIFIFL